MPISYPEFDALQKSSYKFCKIPPDGAFGESGGYFGSFLKKGCVYHLFLYLKRKVIPSRSRWYAYFNWDFFSSPVTTKDNCEKEVPRAV